MEQLRFRALVWAKPHRLHTSRWSFRPRLDWRNNRTMILSQDEGWGITQENLGASFLLFTSMKVASDRPCKDVITCYVWLERSMLGESSGTCYCNSYTVMLPMFVFPSSNTPGSTKFDDVLSLVSQRLENIVHCSKRSPLIWQQELKSYGSWLLIRIPEPEVATVKP